MGILTEAIQALIIVGLPIGLFTLAMIWWALHRGHLQKTEDFKGLEHEIKSMTKNKNKKKQKSSPRENNSDFIHKKWMSFGGGFYGIVALFTWLVIEINEIVEMVSNLGGILKFLQSLNIGLIVHVFIEGFMNFIIAIIWPVYWIKQISTGQTWIWFIAAFAGYSIGMKLAHKIHQSRVET